MSILVEVGLLSGRTATVKAYLEEEVRSLCLRAQTSLGVGKGAIGAPNWKHSGCTLNDRTDGTSEW